MCLEYIDCKYCSIDLGERPVAAESEPYGGH